jgi:hypothetical protein
VIVKKIVEKQMECRLARETEVLGENLPQRHFCPLQSPTWPDPGLNPGRRCGKPATNRLSYGAAFQSSLSGTGNNQSSARCLFRLGFLLPLTFSIKDIGDISLRNVRWLSMNCKELYPRWQNSSHINLLICIRLLLTYLRSWALPEKLPIVQPPRNFQHF